jgi:hypothetical protein
MEGEETILVKEKKRLMKVKNTLYFVIHHAVLWIRDILVRIRMRITDLRIRIWLRILLFSSTKNANKK